MEQLTFICLYFSITFFFIHSCDPPPPPIKINATHCSCDDPVLPRHKFRSSDRQVAHFKSLDKSLEKRTRLVFATCGCDISVIIYMDV